LGEFSTRAALEKAYELGLDLVEINPTNRPPICKIMDYVKYKYDLSKKEKEARINRKDNELKEIRLTFKIGDHDIEYKAKQAKEFFDSGNQVKISMKLRGRENAFVGEAMKVFDKFSVATGLGYENPPRKFGNQIITNLAALKTAKS